MTQSERATRGMEECPAMLLLPDGTMRIFTESISVAEARRECWGECAGLEESDVVEAQLPGCGTSWEHSTPPKGPLGELPADGRSPLSAGSGASKSKSFLHRLLSDGQSIFSRQGRTQGQPPQGDPQECQPGTAGTSCVGDDDSVLAPGRTYVLSTCRSSSLLPQSEPVLCGLDDVISLYGAEYASLCSRGLREGGAAMQERGGVPWGVVMRSGGQQVAPLPRRGQGVAGTLGPAWETGTLYRARVPSSYGTVGAPRSSSEDVPLVEASCPDFLPSTSPGCTEGMRPVGFDVHSLRRSLLQVSARGADSSRYALGVTGIPAHPRSEASFGNHLPAIPPARGSPAASCRTAGGTYPASASASALPLIIDVDEDTPGVAAGRHWSRLDGVGSLQSSPAHSQNFRGARAPKIPRPGKPWAGALGSSPAGSLSSSPSHSPLHAQVHHGLLPAVPRQRSLSRIGATSSPSPGADSFPGDLSLRDPLAHRGQRMGAPGREFRGHLSGHVERLQSTPHHHLSRAASAEPEHEQPGGGWHGTPLVHPHVPRPSSAGPGRGRFAGSEGTPQVHHGFSRAASTGMWPRQSEPGAASDAPTGPPKFPRAASTGMQGLRGAASASSDALPRLLSGFSCGSPAAPTGASLTLRVLEKHGQVVGWSEEAACSGTGMGLHPRGEPSVYQPPWGSQQEGTSSHGAPAAGNELLPATGNVSHTNFMVGNGFLPGLHRASSTSAVDWVRQEQRGTTHRGLPPRQPHWRPGGPHPMHHCEALGVPGAYLDRPTCGPPPPPRSMPSNPGHSSSAVGFHPSLEETWRASGMPTATSYQADETQHAGGWAGARGSWLNGGLPEQMDALSSVMGNHRRAMSAAESRAWAGQVQPLMSRHMRSVSAADPQGGEASGTMTVGTGLDVVSGANEGSAQGFTMRHWRRSQSVTEESIRAFYGGSAGSTPPSGATSGTAAGCSTGGAAWHGHMGRSPGAAWVGPTCPTGRSMGHLRSRSVAGPETGTQHYLQGSPVGCAVAVSRSAGAAAAAEPLPRAVVGHGTVRSSSPGAAGSWNGAAGAGASGGSFTREALGWQPGAGQENHGHKRGRVFLPVGTEAHSEAHRRSLASAITELRQAAEKLQKQQQSLENPQEQQHQHQHHQRLPSHWQPGKGELLQGSHDLRASLLPPSSSGSNLQQVHGRGREGTPSFQLSQDPSVVFDSPDAAGSHQEASENGEEAMRDVDTGTLSQHEASCIVPPLFRSQSDRTSDPAASLAVPTASLAAARGLAGSSAAPLRLPRKADWKRSHSVTEDDIQQFFRTTPGADSDAAQGQPSGVPRSASACAPGATSGTPTPGPSMDEGTGQQVGQEKGKELAAPATAAKDGGRGKQVEKGALNAGTQQGRMQEGHCSKGRDSTRSSPPVQSQKKRTKPHLPSSSQAENSSSGGTLRRNSLARPELHPGRAPRGRVLEGRSLLSRFARHLTDSKSAPRGTPEARPGAAAAPARSPSGSWFSSTVPKAARATPRGSAMAPRSGTGMASDGDRENGEDPMQGAHGEASLRQGCCESSHRPSLRVAGALGGQGGGGAGGAEGGGPPVTSMRRSRSQEFANVPVGQPGQEDEAAHVGQDGKSGQDGRQQLFPDIGAGVEGAPARALPRAAADEAAATGEQLKDGLRPRQETGRLHALVLPSLWKHMHASPAVAEGGSGRGGSGRGGGGRRGGRRSLDGAGQGLGAEEGRRKGVQEEAQGGVRVLLRRSVTAGVGEGGARGDADSFAASSAFPSEMCHGLQPGQVRRQGKRQRSGKRRSLDSCKEKAETPGLNGAQGEGQGQALSRGRGRKSMEGMTSAPLDSQRTRTSRRRSLDARLDARPGTGQQSTPKHSFLGGLVSPKRMAPFGRLSSSHSSTLGESGAAVKSRQEHNFMSGGEVHLVGTPYAHGADCAPTACSMPSDNSGASWRRSVWDSISPQKTRPFGKAAVEASGAAEGAYAAWYTGKAKARGEEGGFAKRAVQRRKSLEGGRSAV